MVPLALRPAPPHLAPAWPERLRAALGASGLNAIAGVRMGDSRARCDRILNVNVSLRHDHALR